ncbi:MAG: hypothetical protein ACRBBS_15670 [Thalassovita sp.]
MFLELIATFIAGIAGAGVLMLLNRALGKRLPRWMIPVAAGAAMLVSTISSEYSWYSRTSGSLPEGIEVAETVESKVMYRPWTYAKPFVERFVAVDVATARRNPDQPGIVLVDLLFFGRWQPLRKLAVMFDCQNNRQTLVPEEVNFDADGALIGAQWGAISPDEPTFELACGGA